MNAPTPGEALVPWQPAAEALPVRALAPTSIDPTVGGFTVSGLLTMLWQHKRLMIASTFVGFLLAALFVFVIEPPEYRAIATLRISDERRVLTSDIEDPALQYDPTERIASPLLSEIELLKSRTVVGAVVDSVGLRLIPDFYKFDEELLSDVSVARDAPVDTLDMRFGATDVTVKNVHGQTVRAPYKQLLRIGGVSFRIAAKPEADEQLWFVNSREGAIDDVLLNRLTTFQRPQTDVVDLGFVARRPALAKAAVVALVATYESMSAEAAQQTSRLRRMFLEEQVRQTDAMLNDAQLALTAFRQRAQVYSARDRLIEQQHDLTVLDQRRAELSADRRMYESLLAELSSPRSTERDTAIYAIVANPDVAANPVVTQLYATLGRYQTSYDSLTTGVWRAANTDPNVVRLRDLITSTNAQLGAAVRSQLASMRARGAALDSMRVATVAASSALPGVDAEEMRLESRVQTIQKMGDELRVDYEKARMAEAAEVGAAQIVDLPTLPYKPVQSFVLKLIKLILGTMLGFMMGGGLAVLREVRNTSIRRREDLERVLQIPGLATIPSLRGKADRANRRALKAGERLPAAMGRAAEAFRVLRTNLLFSPRGASVRTLVVTSAAPGEGKTLTAANLAATSARDGMRVLLVDCDFRRSRLHAFFDTPRAPGMSDILRGTSPLADAVRATDIPGLSVLPAGSIEPRTINNPPSTALAVTLRQLSAEFDLVVIDTAPVLAFADASLVGALADGVLLVVRAGETDRDEAQRAMHQLTGVGANVVGAILNDPHGRASQMEKYYEAYEVSGKKRSRIWRFHRRKATA